MGRKKIEIRPLVDERNRNVTFLKRKAGLMKKAWELSVLCGADVSILIFSTAGKAFEFSSRDLDGEIDRYLGYEGLIERRRAEEFAAMAEAGEDDDDDDEDDGGGGGHGNGNRRGSSSKAALAAAAAANNNSGAGKPVKSLKGKESFKNKMPSLREIGTVAERRKRKRERDSRPRQGFIEGLVTESEGDGDEEGVSRDGSDLAGLNYAMSLGPNSTPSQNPLYPSSTGLPYTQPSSYFRSSSIQPKHEPSPPSSNAPFMPFQYNPNQPPAPVNYPPNMGGLQWDPALLQRYAEFQMQQNHQRQQRLLLERQREQLALMGVQVGGEAERRLMDDIFGIGGGSGSASASGRGSISVQGGAAWSEGQNHGHQPTSVPAPSTNQAEEFVWPSFTNPHPNPPQSSHTTYPQVPQRHNSHPQTNPYTIPSNPSVSPETVNQQHSYRSDEYDLSTAGRQTTPASTVGGTPWYAGLSGDGGHVGDELAFGEHGTEYEQHQGRKRGVDILESAGGAGAGDKRIRVV